MPVSPTPLSIDHRSLADALLAPVLAAARIQMHYFHAGTPVHAKADASPVTAADRESEALILAALADIAPSIPVVAEEAMAAGAAPAPVALRADGRRAGEFFLVDPLDGTREFVAGRAEFTINIALVADGVPRFGFIFTPADGTFSVTLGDALAVSGQIGALSAGMRAPATFAELTMVPLRTRAAPPGGLVAVVSRSHDSPGTDVFLGQYAISQRTAAGSSLKFCVLARGAADIYPRIGPTCEWDIAAGHAILAAAGGAVTQLDGSAMAYGNAANGYRNCDFVAWGRGPLSPTH